MAELDEKSAAEPLSEGVSWLPHEAIGGGSVAADDLYAAEAIADNYQSDNCKKIDTDISEPAVEARTMVLVKHTQGFLRRSDIDSWIFSNLYSRIAVGRAMDKVDLYRPVFVSSSLSNWRTLSYQHQTQDLAREHYLTLHTKVFTTAPLYNLLLVVDVSASVNSVDKFVSGSHVVMESLFSVLYSLLSGLAIPLQIQETRASVLVSVLLNMGEFSPSNDSRRTFTTNSGEGVKDHRGDGGANVTVVAQEFDLKEKSFQLLFKKISQAVHSHEGKTTERQEGSKSSTFTSMTTAVEPTQAHNHVGPTAAAITIDKNRPALSLLDYALSVIKMGSPGATPLMIYLTDGILSMGFREHRPSDIIRNFSAEDIPVHVVLLTCNDGYSPNCSFGHVPDIEEMRFLTLATGGRFLYANDFPRDVAIDYDDTHYLNFLHRAFLLRERVYFKASKAEQRMSSVLFSQHERKVDLPREVFADSKIPLLVPTAAESAFPWSFSSRSPPVLSLLARYRDYDIPTCLNHFLKARINEGFAVQSITGDFSNGKTEKASINLVLFWAPYITIQYRIKVYLALAYNTPYPLTIHAARVELNVLAFKEFAYLFVNFQTIATKRTASEIALRASIAELHDYLKVLYDGDMVQKVVLEVSRKLFRQPIQSPLPSLQSQPQVSTNSITKDDNNSPKRDELSQTLTQIIESLLKAKGTSSFNCYTFDIIMRNAIFARQLRPIHRDLGNDNNGPARGLTRDETTRLKLSATLKQLEDILEQLSTFKLTRGGGETVFVKLLEHSPEHAKKFMVPDSISFVAFWLAVDNTYLAQLRLRFFNTNIKQELKYVATIRCSLIDSPAAEHLLSSRRSSLSFVPGPSLPTFVFCVRPVITILLKGLLGKSNQSSNGNATMETSFLRKHEWSFGSELFADGHELMQMFPSEISSLDLAYEHIVKARLDEGFCRIAETRDEIVFYLERSHIDNYRVQNTALADCVVGTVYIIARDQFSLCLQCKMLLEPIDFQTSGGTPFVRLIRSQDERIISETFTFDHLYTGWLRKNLPSRDRINTSIRSFFDPSQAFLTSTTFIAGIPSGLKASPHSSCPPTLYSTPASLTEGLQNENPDVTSTLPLIDTTIGTLLNVFDEHCCPDVCQKQIQSLSSTKRKQLLLNLYLRRSAQTIVDFEIVKADMGTATQDFVENILQTLQNYEATFPGASRYRFCMNSCHFRCFVQGRRSISYVLVLVPSLCGLLREDASADDPALSYLPLMLTDVHRTRPDTLGYRLPLQFSEHHQPATCTNNMTTIISPFTLLTRRTAHHSSSSIWIAKTFATPPPHPMQQQQQPSPAKFLPQNLPPSLMYLERAISYHWEAAFVRMVGATVLQNEHVSMDELTQALSYCAIAETKIDATQFLLILYKRRQLQLRVNETSINKKWMQVIELRFRRLFSCEAPSLFIHIPHTLKDSAIVSIDDIIRAAHTPVFLQLRAQLRVNDQQWLDVVDISAALSGLSEHNPTLCADTLLLVPPKEPLLLFKFSFMRPKSDIDVASAFSNDPVVSTLSDNTGHNFIADNARMMTTTADTGREHVPVQEDLEHRLRCFFKEETLNNLIGVKPISVSMVRHIFTVLSDSISISSHYAGFQIPLVFVKPPHDFFIRALDKLDMIPYAVMKVGTVYVLTLAAPDVKRPITLDVQSSTDLSSTLTSSPDLHSETIASSSDAVSATSNNSPQWLKSVAADYIEGLGIVVDQVNENKDNGGIHQGELKESVESPTNVSPGFWFLFFVQENAMQVLYYESSVDLTLRESLFTSFRQAVTVVIHTANQQTLLADLRETHACSKFLVTPDLVRHPRATVGSVNSSNHIMTSGQPDSLRSTRKHQIGQFECPIVYRHAFDLHWRMKPNSALNNIASVLSPFSVTNRRNMFVVSAGSDSVFYMRIREAVKTDKLGNETKRELLSSDSAYLISIPSTQCTPTIGIAETTPSSMSTTQTFDGSSQLQMRESPSPRSTAPSSPRSRLPSTHQKVGNSSEARVLIMELHGVEAPSKAFVDELISMIESKLTAATLSVLSSFLMRSSTAKLTKADIDFLIPSIKGPRRRAYYILPGDIPNPHRLLLYLKQNISTFLNVLAGPDIAAALSRHYQRHFDVEWPILESQPHTQTIQPGDFTFLYHSVSNRLLPGTETAIGQGVACVSFTPVQEDSVFLYELPYKHPRPYTADTISHIVDQISNNGPFESAAGEGKVSLLVEVWAIGAVDIDALLHQLQQSIQQSSIDYCAEATLLAYIGTDHGSLGSLNMLGERLAICLQSSRQSSRQSNCSIHSSKLEARLPPWSLHGFHDDVQRYLGTVCDAFEFVSSENISTKQQLIKFKNDKNRSSFLLAFPKTLRTEPTLIAATTLDAPSEVDVSSQISLDNINTDTDSIFGSSKVTDLPTIRHAPPLSGETGFVGAMYAHMTRVNHVDVERNFIALVIVRLATVDVIVYNWKRPFFDSLLQHVQQYLDIEQQKMKMHTCIALQKMGMFEQQVDRWTGMTDQDAEQLLMDEGEIRVKSKQNGSIIPLSSVYRESFLSNRDCNQSTTIHFYETSAKNFLLCRSEQEVMLTRQKQLLGIYERWTRRHESSDKISDLTTSDVQHIFRAVRLIHWVRMPLLFSQKRDELFMLSGGRYFCSTLLHPSQQQQQQVVVVNEEVDYTIQESTTVFYRQIVTKLIASYVSYLKSLGMSVIISKGMENEQQQQQQGNNSILIPSSSSSSLLDTHRFLINRTQSSETDIVYMQKSFQGGILLIEFSVSGLFVCVNLHTVNRRYGRHKMRQPSPGFSTPDYSRQSFKLFTEECTRFKNLIHLNSFIYDFHLQTILNMLENGTATQHLNPLELLRAFIRYNPVPARFARCLLHQDIVSISNQEITNDLLPYILCDPRRYGMSQVEVGQGVSNACYLSSIATSLEPDYCFTVSEKRQAEYRYVLVLAPPCKSSIEVNGSLTLQYFIMIINMDNKWPYQTLAVKASQSGEEVNGQGSLTSGYSNHRVLRELVSNAEKKVQGMIDKAVRFFNRDALWKTLVNGGIHRTTPNVSIEELLTLSRRFSTFSLVQLDATLCKLFALPQWSKILNELLQGMPFSGREVNTQGTRLVTLFHSDSKVIGHIPEVVYQLVVQEERAIEAMLVIREDTSVLDEESQRNMQIFVRCLSRAVWQTMQV